MDKYVSRVTVNLSAKEQLGDQDAFAPTGVNNTDCMEGKGSTQRNTYSELDHPRQKTRR